MTEAEKVLTEQKEVQKRTKIKLRPRPIIVGAFLLLVCAAAYTDFRLDRSPAEGQSYIYTSTEPDGKTKILGEAALVDSTVNTSGGEEKAQEAPYDAYFTAMQADRRRMRSEAMETLQTVVDSSDSMPDVKEKAYNEMMTIANNITIESNIRSMVMAKGFTDCIAVINGNDLSVIVKTDGLLTNEVAQIKEIAMNESGFSAENIRIVEKND